MEFLYFIKETGNLNYVKIGFTKNLNKRLSDLQTGNPRQLYYDKCFILDDCKNKETILHKICKDKCIRGEWYYLNKKQLDSIYSQIQSYVSGTGNKLFLICIN